MQRSALTIVCLLAVFTAASGAAQTVGDPGIQFQSSGIDTAAAMLPGEDPGIHNWPSAYPSLPGPPVAAAPSQPAVAFPRDSDTDGTIDLKENEMLLTDSPTAIAGLANDSRATGLSEFLGYRWATGSLDWIPGDQLGAFSVNWDHYIKEGVNQGVGAGLGLHFLDGPDQSDMPARLYDFSLAYQFRDRFGPLGIDVATAVLAASDFKGSAGKGILFPSHAVAFLTVRPTLDVALGVDYLDRGDIKLLPVGGVVWTPTPETRFELFFPRPRAIYQLTDDYRIYISGELGGGSWAIERGGLLGNDLATYRDLRACIGVEWTEKDGERSAFEIGYLFDRRLEYTSGIGDISLDNAVMFRLITTF